MRRVLALCLLVFSMSIAGAQSVAAQDLVIANVRIIVGNGSVVDRGSIVIRGGRIASVAAGAASAAGVQTLDASGMTASRDSSTVIVMSTPGPTRRNRCSSFSTRATRRSCLEAVRPKAI